MGSDDVHDLDVEKGEGGGGKMEKMYVLVCIHTIFKQI